MQRGLPSLLGSLILYLAGSSSLLLTTSCLSSPYVTGIVHESSNGSVYLEEVPDLAFQASHPISIEPDILARVLQGVQIREISAGAERSGKPRFVLRSAFLVEDTQFLAPLLSTALSLAGRGDQVVFRSIRSTNSSPIATAGTVYVHGSFLYLTLTHYQYTPHDPELLYKAKPQLPYSSALTRRVIRFVPKKLGGPTDDKPPGAPPQLTHTTLAIDYNGMAEITDTRPGLDGNEHQPGTAQAHANGENGSGAGGPALSADDARKVNQLIHEKELELEALKNRVRALERKLAERDTLIKKMKKKQKPAKRKKKKTVKKKR